MANYYFIEMTEGGERRIVTDPSAHKDHTVLTELDSLPEEFHIWDDATQSFVEDTARKADAEAGSFHITYSHLIKQVEAAMIISGYQLQAGLLYEEAQSLGINLNDLASQVLVKSQQLRDKEVDRRSKKYVG